MVGVVAWRHGGGVVAGRRCIAVWREGRWGGERECGNEEREEADDRWPMEKEEEEGV